MLSRHIWGQLMHSFAIIAALLFVSLGFTSAYADDSFIVNPEEITFDYVT